MATPGLFWAARGRRPQATPGYSGPREGGTAASRGAPAAARPPARLLVGILNGKLSGDRWKKRHFLFLGRAEARRMTHQGAVLQSYNNELVKFVEELHLQREELNKQIEQEEEEKKKVQDELEMLTKQLACVCERLAWKTTSQKELDKILTETEVAYEKILESSRTLLKVLKAEIGNLDKIMVLKSTVGEDVQLFEAQSTQH